MAVMKLALYKGEGNFYDLLTRLVTFSKYSHCELVIDGVCYSSSPRDGGVRAKIIDLQDGQWDTYSIKGDKVKALSWFNNHDGKSYDWMGTIKSVIPLFVNHKDKWFCSEAIAAALNIEKPYRFTPVGLYRFLVEDRKGN